MAASWATLEEPSKVSWGGVLSATVRTKGFSTGGAMPSDTLITMEWVPTACGSEVPERMDEPLASSVRFSPDGRELEEKAKALPSGSEAKKR